MRLLFWFSLVFIIYTYAGYPCLLWIWSRLFPKKVSKAIPTALPLVSIIIAAHNEEKNIQARLENLIEQNYPSNKLEIIVASDGSTDATCNIVSRFIEHHPAPPSIYLIEIQENRGKPHALNMAAQKARGQYLVFTDARQKFESNAVRELIGNFSDPAVGCVSGELVFYEDSDTNIKAEMGFYWNLEKKIRNMEGLISSVAGATGAIYAIRKDLFHPIPESTLLDDVYVPMKIVLNGYRTVFDGKAIAYDIVSKDLAQEKRRKVRTLLGNYQLLKLMPELFSWRRNPIFFQFFSHKVFRLFVPFFFFAMLFSSAVAPGAIYKLGLFVCLMILILPFANGLLKPIPIVGKISTMARTFVSLNYFAFLAFLYLLKPGRKEVW